MAGETQEDIINGALTKLGANPITALTDGSLESERVEYVYDFVLKDLQRSYPWKFLITRGQLTEDATPPEWGYSARYAMPIDSLRLLDVRSTGVNTGYAVRNLKGDAWDLEAGFILCDVSDNIWIRYLKYEPVVEKWDDSFMLVMMTALALELCEAFTQDGNKKNQLARELSTRLLQAASNDSFEMQPRTLNDPSNYEKVRWQAPGTTRSIRAYK